MKIMLDLCKKRNFNDGFEEFEWIWGEKSSLNPQGERKSTLKPLKGTQDVQKSPGMKKNLLEPQGVYANTSKPLKMTENV